MKMFTYPNNLRLEEFPDAIANLERQVLQYQLGLNQAETFLENVKFQIVKKIVFNPDFKNEQQREIAKTEALNSSEAYLKKKEYFDDCKKNRDEALIELAKVKNQFSVAKIQARLRIAEMGVES